MKEFGPILKKYRTERGLTLKQLAEKVGVVYSAIADYERGAKAPKVEMREQLIHALDADPIEMLGVELTEAEEIRLLNNLLTKYNANIVSPEEKVEYNPNTQVVIKLKKQYIL